MYNIDKIVKKIKKHGIENVEIGIVAGSGLLSAVPEFDETKVLEYDKIGLPKSKVKGHSGKFIFGKLNGKSAVIISRIHYYESGDIAKVRLPFEIVSALGVKDMILMTSCGGVNKSFKVGDLMVIEDHINLSGINPLIGIDNLDFTNMTNCYNKELINEIKDIARQEDIDIKCGIHGQLSGPSYETNAEVDMMKKIGIDSVSMSTAHDCIICNFLDMRVVGFSVIVNEFNGGESDLNHQEVLDNANKACEKLKKILINLI